MYIGHDNSYLQYGGIYEISHHMIKSYDKIPKVILDMGSRHGEGYDKLGIHFPNSTYIFVEPAPNCAYYITKKCELFLDRKLVFVPGILAEFEGITTLNTFPNDDDQAANLYTDRNHLYGVPIPVEVKIFSYSSLSEYTNIDFAKINIEGGEYELIKSNFFDKIEHFIMEVHNFIPNKSYADIITQLQNKYDLTTYGNLNYKYCYIIGHRINK